MVYEADFIAHNNESTPALRKKNALANEEDNAEDKGETGKLLREDDAHDSAARTRDAARATDKATDTDTADVQENTQITEVDTSTDGDDTEDDAEEDDDEDEDLDDTNSRENSPNKQQTEPIPKRSQRVKKTPSWITSGDYVVNHQVVTKQPDWKTRADYLQTSVSSDVFHSKSSK